MKHSVEIELVSENGALTVSISSNNLNALADQDILTAINQLAECKNYLLCDQSEQIEVNKSVYGYLGTRTFHFIERQDDKVI